MPETVVVLLEIENLEKLITLLVKIWYLLAAAGVAE